MVETPWVRRVGRPHWDGAECLVHGGFSAPSYASLLAPGAARRRAGLAGLLQQWRFRARMPVPLVKSDCRKTRFRPRIASRVAGRGSASPVPSARAARVSASSAALPRPCCTVLRCLRAQRKAPHPNAIQGTDLFVTLLLPLRSHSRRPMRAHDRGHYQPREQTTPVNMAVSVLRADVE